LNSPSHSPKNRPPAFQVAALTSYSMRASLADVGPPRTATWSAVAENAVATSMTTEFTSPNAVIEAAPTGLTRRKTRKNPTAARAWVSTVTRSAAMPRRASPSCATRLAAVRVASSGTYSCDRIRRKPTMPEMASPR